MYRCERCVCCGEAIPEGRQVCPACEKGTKREDIKMTNNDFLQKYRRVEYGMNVTRPRVRCADGYTVSVQAGYGLYSIPRADADRYKNVELGYPSTIDEELDEYAESPGGVYGYVPVRLVDKVLEKHGGIVGTDFLNVTPGNWPDDQRTREGKQDAGADEAGQPV